MGPREHPLRRPRLVGPAEPDEVGPQHQAQVGGGEADGGVRRTDGGLPQAQGM